MNCRNTGKKNLAISLLTYLCFITSILQITKRLVTLSQRQQSMKRKPELLEYLCWLCLLSLLCPVHNMQWMSAWSVAQSNFFFPSLNYRCSVTEYLMLWLTLWWLVSHFLFVPFILKNHKMLSISLITQRLQKGFLIQQGEKNDCFNSIAHLIVINDNNNSWH